MWERTVNDPMSAGESAHSFPDQRLARYAQLAAASFAETRDLLTRSDIPTAVDQEWAIAIQAAMDAQHEQIRNLTHENSLRQQRERFLLDFSRSSSARLSSLLSEFLTAETSRIGAIQTRLAALSSTVRRLPLPSRIRVHSSAGPDLFELSQQVVKFQETGQHLMDENAALRAEADDLRQKLQTTTQVKSVLTSTNLELSARIDDLELRLSTAGGSSDADLQSRVADLSRALATATQAFDERAGILGEQLSAALSHAEGLKSRAMQADADCVDLNRQLRSLTLQLNGAQRQLQAAEIRAEQAESEVRGKDEIVGLLSAQKDELTREHQRLFERNDQRQSQNEVFVNSLAGILGCERGDVAGRISDVLVQLERAQDKAARAVEADREIQMLRARNAALEARLRHANEQLDAQARNVELLRAGRDSDVVGQIYSNCEKLKALNCQLYEEQQAAEAKLFEAEKALAGAQRALEAETAARSSLSVQLERFEFYEFSVDHLGEMLSNLSAQIVSALPDRHSQLEVVDRLLIDLRRRAWEPGASEERWRRFGQAVADAFALDCSSIAQMLSCKVDRFMDVVSSQMRTVHDRIATTACAIVAVRGKAGRSRRPQSMNDRALRPTPIRGPRKFDRSPLTPGDKPGFVGLTPRLGTSLGIEPPTRRFE
jgi:regulator of replication initiation timing